MGPAPYIPKSPVRTFIIVNPIVRLSFHKTYYKPSQSNFKIKFVFSPKLFNFYIFAYYKVVMFTNLIFFYKNSLDIKVKERDTGAKLTKFNCRRIEEADVRWLSLISAIDTESQLQCLVAYMVVKRLPTLSTTTHSQYLLRLTVLRKAR